MSTLHCTAGRLSLVRALRFGGCQVGPLCPGGTGEPPRASRFCVRRYVCQSPLTLRGGQYGVGLGPT
eukprot:8297988-Lingulodinium_polyedra.AAC.1